MGDPVVSSPKVSVVIPVYNEESAIPLVLDSLLQMLEEVDFSYEVIIVDDGSTDGSVEAIKPYLEEYPFMALVQFQRNFGQTSAMSAGFEHAGGDIIVPMDGDSQNDPADIPRLIAELEKGYDVVSGWRKNRKDNGITRVLPSVIANWLISRISGVHLHDYGCSLKAYRREVLEGVRLYGEMHRFIPIYAHWQGAKVTELEIKHHPRMFGDSKYNLTRTFRVILDLLLIKFMGSFAQSPIHFFGGFGLGNFLLSFVTFLMMLYFKFFGDKSFVETPLPQLSVLFFLVGVLSIFLGMLAEMLMRTYYESQGKSVYVVRQRINFNRSTHATPQSSQHSRTTAA